MKYILVNLLICLALFIFGLFIIYEHFLGRKLTEDAKSKVTHFREHPLYHPELEDLGSFPARLIREQKSTAENKVISIAAFGDSNTAGSEVDRKMSFPEQLQGLLGPSYQVQNFGKGGYNSNQIYQLAKFILTKSNYDIVIFGPRGFYLERATTFNNYWNQGNLPYARYLIKDEDLEKKTVEGASLEEKIANYYSFFSTKTVLQHDHSPISASRMLFYFFGLQLPNPFKTFEPKADLIAIQKKQIEHLADITSAQIIHYTDDSRDCKKFQSVTKTNYRLICVDHFVSEFPFKAEVSHASALGNLQHALTLEATLKNRAMAPQIKIVEERAEFKTLNLYDLSHPSNPLADLSVISSNLPIAHLGLSKGYLNSMGLVKTYGKLKDLYSKQTRLIGFHSSTGARANSLFVGVSDEVFEQLRDQKIEIEQQIDLNGVGFIKVDGKVQSSDRNLTMARANLNHIFKKLFVVEKRLRENKVRLRLKNEFPSFRFILNPTKNPMSYLDRERQELVIKFAFSRLKRLQSSNNQQIYTPPLTTRDH